MSDIKWVRVSFVIEGDDPDHETGVTEETYNVVNDAVLNIGGMDIEFVPEEE